MIFLTDYAQKTVQRVTGPLRAKIAVVPHGIHCRFISPPRPQLAIGEYSLAKPFRLLYVAMIDVYKHQWNVAQAVANLRAAGFPVALDLVGPAYGPALQRLCKLLKHIDATNNFIRYLGAVPHGEVHRLYNSADLFVFASSCENMPNILLEGMASGLPIACSSRGPMPEVLGDAGIYFDPEDVPSIARAIEQLIASPALRKEKAQVAFDRVGVYSWQQCAEATFGFLAAVARDNLRY
jgi:glycosyltransferase involved in cell wall biosynthesis